MLILAKTLDQIKVPSFDPQKMSMEEIRCHVCFFKERKMIWARAVEKQAAELHGEWKGEWEWKGEESMHPFWAVQRMHAQKDAKPFNMTFQALSFHTVAMGVVAKRGVNVAAEVVVPFLTNDKEIPHGAELRLQIEEASRTTAPTKRNWKDSVAEKRKEAEKAAKSARKGNAESTEGVIDI